MNGSKLTNIDIDIIQEALAALVRNGYKMPADLQDFYRKATLIKVTSEKIEHLRTTLSDFTQ